MLCLFAQFLSKTFKAVTSVRNYISGIHTLHSLLDLTCPAFGSLELKLTLRGLARSNPHCTKQASPITPQILRGIYYLLKLSNPVHATMWSLLLLGFFTLSRKSNLVVTGKNKFNPQKQLCRSDVISGKTGLLVRFRWSKTNQFGDRILWVPLVAIPGSVLCPVQAYRNMLALVPASPHDPAFVVPGRHMRPVTYESLQKFLKTCIAALGLDPSLYSSHSLRRGGATWAFQAQVPAELIKTHGDWKSHAYLRYLEFSLPQRMEVAQGMALEIVNRKY